MTFNPVNGDYSYLRYSAALGAGGDICGWSEAERLPDLVHSRDCSPTTTLTSSTVPSPLTVVAPLPSTSETKVHPDPTSQSSSLGLIAEEAEEADSNAFSDLTFFDAPGDNVPENFDPEADVSYQITELEASFVNPFTNQEYYVQLPEDI